jgi:2-oxoisovalerate dehydrogenase E1 component alpha subunit
MFQSLKSLKRYTNSTLRFISSSCAKREAANASSISDKSFYPGYKGEFTTNLNFNFPENSPHQECYRVMNRKGVVLDPEHDPKFTREESEKLLKIMISLTKLDDFMQEAQRQGRISFYMPNHGEHAAQLGSAHALNPKDLVFSQYREAGVALYRGFTIQQACDQIFGNDEGSCKGRQMPVHYGSKEFNFVTVSSTIATQLSQAVGSAYSFKRKQNGLCCIAYFGDGGSSEGDTHAALNFAAVFDVPIIFLW